MYCFAANEILYTLEQSNIFFYMNQFRQAVCGNLNSIPFRYESEYETWQHNQRKPFV